MSITENDLANARAAWGDALVAIAKAYEADGIDGARALASEVIDAAYGYNLGPVLFKPTLASGAQTFRTTKEGALSYFVGHDDAYPLDGGFGIKGWRTAEFETAAFFTEGDVGMWMGFGTFRQRRKRHQSGQNLWLQERRRGQRAHRAAPLVAAVSALISVWTGVPRKSGRPVSTPTFYRGAARLSARDLTVTSRLRWPKAPQTLTSQAQSSRT